MIDIDEKDVQGTEDGVEELAEEITQDIPCKEIGIEELSLKESMEQVDAEKPKKKLGERWQEYVDKHPKLEKMAKYINEHKTLLQAILFMLFSCLAFVAQLGTQALFDWALASVDKVVKVWPFPEQALGTLISFLIANVVAKVLSFIMNRKKTFNANNNKIFSIVTYTIMVVVLIIAETLVGEPLANALDKASNGVLGEWANTLAIIIYSIPDFIIVFLMNKFVIMRHKEEKEEENEQCDCDASNETPDVTEEIVADVTEEPADETTEE